MIIRQKRTKISTYKVKLKEDEEEEKKAMFDGIGTSIKCIANMLSFTCETKKNGLKKKKICLILEVLALSLSSTVFILGFTLCMLHRTAIKVT